MTVSDIEEQKKYVRSDIPQRIEIIVSYILKYIAALTNYQT